MELYFIFNPKAYVIISLMFTIFLDGSQSLIRIILISTIFTVNNCVSFTLWTLFGDLLGAKFRNEKYSKILNKIFSLSLFLVVFYGCLLLKFKRLLV